MAKVELVTKGVLAIVVMGELVIMPTGEEVELVVILMREEGELVAVPTGEEEELVIVPSREEEEHVVVPIGEEEELVISGVTTSSSSVSARLAAAQSLSYWAIFSLILVPATQCVSRCS